MAYLFSYLEEPTPKKNKPNLLETDVLALLKKNDRKVMFAKEGRRFLKDILQDIAHLNKQHPRCRPIAPKMHEEEGDLKLYGIECGVLSLYKSSN